MNYKEKLNRNIWVNNVFQFIQGMNFTNGIWMIYLALKGLSLVEIGILESIFHVTAFLMEVPTGVVADLYGRRTSRIWGIVLSFGSIVLLMLANSFWGYAISFVSMALGYNLESGAGEALIYDSLKELDQTSKFMKVNGHIEIAMQLSGLVALPIGGYLATKNYMYAMGLTLLAKGLAFMVAFLFEEPKIKESVEKQKGMIKSMERQVKESILLFKRVPMTGYLIIVMQIFSLIYTTSWFYIQNYYKGMALDEFQIGVILALAAFFGAVFASVTHRVEAFIKPFGIVVGLPIMALICYWGIALNPLHTAYFIVLSGLEGMYYVAMSDYLNRFIPSQHRATVLSFGAMCFSSMMIVLFPLFGFLGDQVGLEKAFKVMAVFATLVILTSSILLIKKGKLEHVLHNKNKENNFSA